MAGMANNDRPFTQYDNNISPTQEDNGSNGADDRPVPDNGTKDAHFSAGGMRQVSKVDYPLPPDPNTPEGLDYNRTGSGDSAEISDFGLNEALEVGYNGSVCNYGLVGGYPGTPGKGNDESVAGYGVDGSKAGGGKPENTKD